ETAVWRTAGDRTALSLARPTRRCPVGRRYGLIRLDHRMILLRKPTGTESNKGEPTCTRARRPKPKHHHAPPQTVRQCGPPLSLARSRSNFKKSHFRSLALAKSACGSKGAASAAPTSRFGKDA